MKNIHIDEHIYIHGRMDEVDEEQTHERAWGQQQPMRPCPRPCDPERRDAAAASATGQARLELLRMRVVVRGFGP